MTEKKTAFEQIQNQYREALELARDEYEHIQKLKENLEERSMQLQQTMAGLAALVGEEEETWASLGMTDAVRHVLKVFQEPLTPAQVKSKLQIIGFKLGEYENANSAIHTVLKRLVGQGEAASDRSGGKVVYMKAPEFASLKDFLATKYHHPQTQGGPKKLLAPPKKATSQPNKKKDHPPPLPSKKVR